MSSMRLIYASSDEIKTVGLKVELCLSPGDWKYRIHVLQVVDATLPNIDQWEHLSVSSYEQLWQEIEPWITRLGKEPRISLRHDYVPFLLRFLLTLWRTKPSLIVRIVPFTFTEVGRYQIFAVLKPITLSQYPSSLLH